MLCYAAILGCKEHVTGTSDLLSTLLVDYIAFAAVVVRSADRTQSAGRKLVAPSCEIQAGSRAGWTRSHRTERLRCTRVSHLPRTLRPSGNMAASPGRLRLLAILLASFSICSAQVSIDALARHTACVNNVRFDLLVSDSDAFSRHEAESLCAGVGGRLASADLETVAQVVQVSGVYRIAE